ncbi:MAG: thiamine pyrophosphate-binding protein [Geminicoccaceae bacterium]
MRTGGQILIDQLEVEGVSLIFGVPGESYLAALDALFDHPTIRFIVCRQEGGAAMMADAAGRLSGRPGVAFVTRGPGATNASPALHIARQDSVPLVLLIGQVGRDMREREAFQEIDYKAFFGDVAKLVIEVDDARRLPEFVHRAFATATAGRPGPVVLALPEDMLRDQVECPPAAASASIEASPDPAAITRLGDMLAAAERPFVILGGGGWQADGYQAMRKFAENWQLPVGCSFRRQSLFDNAHPCYAGHVGLGINPSLRSRIEGADLVLALGTRLSEASTDGYTLISQTRTDQALVHAVADPHEVGRVYQPSLGIVSGVNRLAEALANLPAPEAIPWRARTEAAHRDYRAHVEPVPAPGALNLSEVLAHIRERLPADAIVCNGAGNYASWVNRFYIFRRFMTQLAPTSGSMGYGMPAAVAAALCRPRTPVLAFAGDGCFLMNGQELATAVQYQTKLIILVVNNGMFGTIRMHQERAYPGRTSGTAIANPDFAALARAYGARGEQIETTAAFGPALERALEAEGPSLIELVIDPDQIMPGKSLADLARPS